MTPLPSVQTLTAHQLPEDLQQLAQPVSKLYVQSTNWETIMSRPRIAIIGSRKVTAYGRSVTQQIARALAARGVVIISGMALGVDSLAHRAALDADGLTMAILPSSLDRIYPASHHALAHEICQSRGALASEYAPGTSAKKWMFIERNRLVAAFSQAVIVTEAAGKSGTLHTAEFALEQGKDVFAVPGNITSPLSVGTNGLIAQGAQLLQNVQDICDALGLQDAPKRHSAGNTPAERAILAALQSGHQTTTQLQATTKQPIQLLNQALTMLEIRGHVQSLGQNQWGLT